MASRKVPDNWMDETDDVPDDWEAAANAPSPTKPRTEPPPPPPPPPKAEGKPASPKPITVKESEADARRRAQRQAEEADFQSTREMFKGTGAEKPAFEIFDPKTEEEFRQLGDLIVEKLRAYRDRRLYTDLVNQVIQGMTADYTPDHLGSLQSFCGELITRRKERDEKLKSLQLPAGPRRDEYEEDFLNPSKAAPALKETAVVPPAKSSSGGATAAVTAAAVGKAQNVPAASSSKTPAAPSMQKRDLKGAFETAPSVVAKAKTAADSDEEPQDEEDEEEEWMDDIDEKLSRNLQ